LCILFCTGNRKCNWYAGTITDGNNKNQTRHVFKYKHTKWSRWCITASLNYKNTMINRITMETGKDRQYCQVCRSGCPTKFFVCILFCIGNATGMPERTRNGRVDASQPV
jgi:hypothetical protein